MNHDEWLNTASRLNRTHRCVGFWIGDMVLDIERRCSENVAVQLIGQAFPDVNETLIAKYRAVAAAYPPDQRFESLTFTHHHLCMKRYLTVPERRAHLQYAVANGLSTSQLKERLRTTNAVKAVLRKLTLSDAIERFNVLVNRWPDEHRAVLVNLCAAQTGE